MKQSYYDAHANEYAELTVRADMSPAYDRFLAYLPAFATSYEAGATRAQLNSHFSNSRRFFFGCFVIIKA